MHGNRKPPPPDAPGPEWPGEVMAELARHGFHVTTKAAPVVRAALELGHHPNGSAALRGRVYLATSQTRRRLVASGLPAPRRLLMLAQLLRVFRAVELTGCSFDSAAVAAGYGDGAFAFSRSCVALLGVRPSAVRELGWRGVLALWAARAA